MGIGDDYFPSPLLPSSSATHAVERYTGPYSPPGLMGGGGRRCSLAPARKKGLWGLLFLPSDSIYMGSSGLRVYYATQAGCEELWGGAGNRGGDGPRTITVETLCRQHQSAVPQEVSKITPWGVPWVDG